MNEITKSEIRKKLGNITQLQDLLFGEQTKEYNQRLDSYSQRLDRLEEDYKKSQLLLDERLEQLEDKLADQISLAINSLEKKIQYLNINHKEEQQKIKQDINSCSQQIDRDTNYIRDSIKTQSKNLKIEIAESKTALNQEIILLKKQINNKLDSSLTELSQGKISRNDLAEVLFELCLKLKEPNSDSEIVPREEN